MNPILTYAKENLQSFRQESISSNEIRTFEYEGKKYIIKIPLNVGENLSPFWQMMKNVFNFTFEKQNAGFDAVYKLLKTNPHIPVAAFVAGDEDMMVFEYAEGKPRTGDDFPQGIDNPYRLGEYIGYNHWVLHDSCGLVGVEDVNDFFPRAMAHMEDCISRYWNTDSQTDKNIRASFNKIRGKQFESAGNVLMMVDMCADQFLYNDEDRIEACVDLDAYIIGPMEWELCFLQHQVGDWNSFVAGYERYRKMPDFKGMSGFFHLIMALNSYRNKDEIEEYWAQFGVNQK